VEMDGGSALMTPHDEGEKTLKSKSTLDPEKA